MQTIRRIGRVFRAEHDPGRSAADSLPFFPLALVSSFVILILAAAIY
jgi:hypothetical protein